MQYETSENFKGFLIIWGIKCTFSFVNGYSLEIRPDSSVEESFRVKCEEFHENFDKLDWIYGTNTWGENVSFRPSAQQGPFSYFKGMLSLIIDIFLIGYDSDSLEKIADIPILEKFNAIDFCGDSVDSVFSPKYVLKRDPYGRDKIEWYPVTECAKTFKSTICGFPCTIIFTVFVDRKDCTYDTTSLGKLQSILRIEFETPQSISLIEECWQATCYFLSFCTGHFNVTDLEVSLWDKETSIGIYGAPGTVKCQINSEKVENIEFQGIPYNRFQVDWLGERVGQLFELIGYVGSRPRLGFLPRTNVDFNVDSHKIRDICTAFEVEYEFRSDEFESTNAEELVSLLKETVKKYKADHSGQLSEDVYSSAYSSIKFISLSAREKVWRIYSQFKEVIDDGFKGMSCFSEINLDLSEAQTRKDIQWLVRLRNDITHSSGSTEQDIPNAIYSRLRVAIYCSVLVRAGYPIDEIVTIIKAYFKGRME